MHQRLCSYNHSDPFHNLAACLWLQCHRPFICDLNPLLKLLCMDSHTLGLPVAANISYVIILCCLRPYSLEGRCNALSISVFHITEVILVFVPCMDIYLNLTTIISTDNAVAVASISCRCYLSLTDSCRSSTVTLTMLAATLAVGKKHLFQEVHDQSLC
ncbi:hypothetical protein HPG69_011225 [Diceros bicornis minor]|uniref:Olfactory receptor n=1 Tax=Diceros bicornis minor TaxID=77932 RepID=A0A7J7EXW1_DICBM|nr:hypothetical protein HPG69_011225 [Diceros bicornis minor]